MEVLKIILNSNENLQIDILGFSLRKIKNVNKKLKEAVENAYEIEYEYNMEKAFDKFKEFLRKYLLEENNGTT